LATVQPFQLLSVRKQLVSVTPKSIRAKTPAMKSFELDVARALPRRPCHWLNLQARDWALGNADGEPVSFYYLRRICVWS